MLAYVSFYATFEALWHYWFGLGTKTTWLGVPAGFHKSLMKEEVAE